jgi:hypothetical protein
MAIIVVLAHLSIHTYVHCHLSAIWRAGHAEEQGMGCNRPRHSIPQSPTCKIKHHHTSINTPFLNLLHSCVHGSDQPTCKKRGGEGPLRLLLLEYACRGAGSQVKCPMEWHHKDMTHEEIYLKDLYMWIGARTCSRWPGGGWAPASRAWPARCLGTRAPRSRMAWRCSAAAPPAYFHKQPVKTRLSKKDKVLRSATHTCIVPPTWFTSTCNNIIQKLLYRYSIPSVPNYVAYNFLLKLNFVNLIKYIVNYINFYNTKTMLLEYWWNILSHYIHLGLWMSIFLVQIRSNSIKFDFG